MRIISAIATLVLVMGSSWAQEISVPIEATPPSLAVKDHQPRDVKVFKSSMLLPKAQTVYAVAFYRMEKDSLRLFQAFYGSNDMFDTAYYRWENDTTVAIRLHDSKHKKDAAFKVFGKGPSTGIITD